MKRKLSKIKKTTKKILKKEVISKEKITYLNSFINSLSHEFNNLLHIITGYSQYALESNAPDQVKEALININESSKRATGIINNLLLSSQQELRNKDYYGVCDLLETTIAEFGVRIKRQNIKIVKEFNDVPEVKIEKEGIIQVFRNIISNALDAMLSKGDKLKIFVRKAGENMQISFIDNGVGIERKNLGKIFDPFFTTKNTSNKNDISGLGLGLYVVYGVINKHSGSVEVKSQINKGTEIIVKLPTLPIINRGSRVK